MSASTPVPWSEFSHDPRRPESAPLMRRLEKKQRKEIERWQRPELEGRDSRTDERDSE